MKSLIFLINSLFVSSIFADVVDPHFKDQWYLKNNGNVVLKRESDLKRLKVIGKNNVDISWTKISKDSIKKDHVIVAVIDSGVDINHPDLKENIWFNEKSCLNDENNKFKDCYGRNILDGNNDLEDDIGHGTHVAGIIAASNNNIGIRGVLDSNIKILPVKALNSKVNGFTYNGKLITSVIAESMNYAISKNVDVINLSLGWPKIIDTPQVRESFKKAFDKNIVVIAAAGNNNKDLPTFPCSYSNVICVGAIDNQGNLSDFSNYGDRVDFVAPGNGIISTYPQSLESRTLRIKGLEIKDGSSQAAPMVAGIVAAMKLVNPDLTVQEVKNILIQSSHQVNDSNSKKFVNFGLVNMKKAIELSALELENTTIVNNKEIDEVLVNDNGQFSYELNLESLGKNGTDSNKVCIENNLKSISFEQECILTTDKKIYFNGQVEDYTQDAHIELNVSINKNKYKLNLILSKKINIENQKTELIISNIPFDRMALSQPGRMISKMAKVIDRYSLSDKPEYYFVDSTVANQNTKITLIGDFKDNYSVSEIILNDQVNRVLSLHRADVNLDGIKDLMVYSLGKDRKSLELRFYDNNLNNLFKNYSTWILPISTFEGLNIDGQKENFNWTILESDFLGKIRVPVTLKNHLIPDLDNSKDLLLNQKKAVNHIFYFEPILIQASKVELRLRVLDSVEIEESIRKNLGIRSSRDMKNAYLISLMSQNKSDVESGINKAIYLLDNYGEYTYYEVSFFSKLSKAPFKIKEINSTELFESSFEYDVIDAQTGLLSDKKVKTYLLDRSNAHSFIYDNGNVTEILDTKNSWDNPILGLLGSFDTDSGIRHLYENRYSIALVDSKGTAQHLPIYRDSSFPGQSFAEGIKPILINGSVALYINSTLVFGNRVYSMLDSQNQGFIRPIGLSMAIPSNCLALGAEKWEDARDSKYLFLCQSKEGNVQLKSLSLSLE